MSKLGSAPPPPPYKVPLTERIFGIGKLKPVVTDGVSQGDLLSTVQLGAFSLELDPTTGQWQMDSKLEAMYRTQIITLESKLAELEEERLNKNLYELEKRNIELEREKLLMLDENNQLKFKNKVLMAMCTISEGDYKSLCREAGIEPRSQKKPVPTPLNATQSSQPFTAGGAGLNGTVNLNGTQQFSQQQPLLQQQLSQSQQVTPQQYPAPSPSNLDRTHQASVVQHLNLPSASPRAVTPNTPSYIAAGNSPYIQTTPQLQAQPTPQQQFAQVGALTRMQTR